MRLNTRRWTRWSTCIGVLAAMGCGDSTSTNDAAVADVVAPTDLGGDTGARPDVVDAGTPTDTPAPTDNPPPTDNPVPTDNPPPTDNPAPTDNPVPTDNPAPTDVVTPTDAGPGMGRATTNPTNGGALAVTSDGQYAVAANRTANSVSVFRLDLDATTPTAMAPTTLPLANAEPWAVVIANNNNTAYVTLRRSGELVVINDLRGTPTVGARVAVGGEPTGLAIAPSGTHVYVANWSDGTVADVFTTTMAVTRRFDLNANLASSGMLGTVTGRPGLAHPRALVITNNGDASDADETLYATEFFSQARTDAVPTDNSAFDVGRQGVVYRVALADGAVSPPITLAPTTSTGFNDSDGNATGCFPNQLHAAAIANGRVYVTGVCASPRGPTGPVTNMDNSVNPANFKTQVHAAVWVVDTSTNREAATEGLLLTRAFQARYDMLTVPNTGVRRIPLIPNDISFVPGLRVAYVSAYGSDAVFRVDFSTPAAPTVGSGTDRHFIDLAPMGRLPVGVVARSPSRALAINENSRNLSLIDLSVQSVAGVQTSAAAPTGEDAEANLGRRFFVTGLGRWSLLGQGWNSCEACHPDGLTDNVTWFFARGPRQTTSLDGSYGPGGVQRLFNWTAIFDEVHDFELNTRGNSGGVGAIVHRANDGAMPPAVGPSDRIIFDGTAAVAPQVATATNQAGLNGSTRSMMPGALGSNATRSALRDWEDIDVYVRRIRAPNAPSNLAADDVTAGRALFITNNCGACHGTPSWTISRRFWTPGEATNAPMGSLRTAMYALPGGFPAALNPPANNAGRNATLRFADLMTAAANDQINCVLRNVGTFPAMLDANQSGVTPAGAPRVREARANMTTAAQGASGFNPPSLVGMVTGAPYFHAGNARTLEEALSATFAAHHQAFAANFLVDGPDRATQVRQLVAFLLSIDDRTMPVDVPRLPVPGMAGMTYNPDVCPVAHP